MKEVEKLESGLAAKIRRSVTGLPYTYRLADLCASVLLHLLSSCYETKSCTSLRRFSRNTLV
jgi:hypothetical protein